MSQCTLKNRLKIRKGIFSFVFLLAATPLKASRQGHISQLGLNQNWAGGGDTRPQIVVKLSRIYENLRCKGEPYRFSSQQDPSVHTDRHRSCYLYIRISSNQEIVRLKPLRIHVTVNIGYFFPFTHPSFQLMKPQLTLENFKLPAYLGL